MSGSRAICLSLLAAALSEDPHSVPVMEYVRILNEFLGVGRLDIVVNNAGFAWDNVIQKMPDEQRQRGGAVDVAGRTIAIGIQSANLEPQKGPAFRQAGPARWTRPRVRCARSVIPNPSTSAAR